MGAAGFPFVVRAAIEPKDGAHPLDRVLGAVVLDKLEADHQCVGPDPRKVDTSGVSYAA